MKTLFALLFTLLPTASLAETRPAFIAPYLEIQTILAKDSTDGLPAQIPTLVSALKKAGQEKASKAAGLLEGAKSIAEYRDRFQKVSEILLPWMKKHKMKGLILAYCPMKKAYWLQAKGDLRNPYYGAEMLECGVEEEQK
ncbi:MAG: DUF3347 domain-containing protein [Bdellovibrionales bacterium]|nr:DUF3347 domain-containing protein [Bdellovibrionales bacterium]